MSTAAETPKARLGGMGTTFWAILLVLSFLVVTANTAMSTYQGSRLSGAATGAADLQVLSQQLANQANEAVGGNAPAYAAFKATRGQINKTLSGLQERFGQEPGVQGALQQLLTTWKPLDASAGQIVNAEPAVLALAGNANRFGAQVPQLQAQLNEVVRAMSASGAPSSQVYSALQQVVVAGRMARNVTEMRAGGSTATMAGDALARDALLFGQVIEGLRNGNEELGIAPLRVPAAVQALEQSQTLWTGMKRDLDAILGSARSLFAAQSASGAITEGSGRMLEDSKKLFDAFSAFGSVRDTRVFPNLWYTIVGGAILVLSLIALLYSL